MNLRISNDLKELIPTFSVIAYKIDFDEKFNAMQQSKLVDEYLSNIYKHLLEFLTHSKQVTDCIPSFHCMVSMCLQPLPHSLLGSSQLVNESLTDLHLSLAGLLVTFHSESKSIPESFSS